MLIRELFDEIIQEIHSVNWSDAVDISSLSLDSKKVKKGGLFIALPGTRTHGCDYIKEAIKNGAAAILCPFDCMERLGLDVPKEVPLIFSKDIHECGGKVVSKFYGNVSSKLSIIGITGTNGKTTSAFLIDSILKCSGKRTAISGTIFQEIAGKREKATLTTPDLISFHSFLKKAFDAGVTYVISEVSSHALSQGRVFGVNFKSVLFTNLSHDHLDYHKTLEDYFHSKKKLFTTLNPEKSVINIDDPFGKRLLKEAKGEIITYGLKEKADVFPISYSTDLDGIKARVSAFGINFSIKSHLIGNFNIYNILGAIGVTKGLGISNEDIAKGIKALKNVKGRLEPLFINGVYGFVDYAHTPDALKNVLLTLKAIREKRIITIVGCGGNRDRAKRPEMGKIAAKYSDLAIITSDNPRNEDPRSIIKEMLKGVFANLKGKTRVIVRRDDAIRFASQIAQRGDIILLAGKGHEDYQIIGNERLSFDDKIHLENELSEKKFFGNEIQPTIYLLKEAIGGKLINGKDEILERQFLSVSTDSRNVEKEAVFFALRGERFDGHDFLDEVLEKGAICAVVDKKRDFSAPSELPLIKVQDTLFALGDLARWYLEFLGVKTIGITGSCGKTTTKELLKAVLSKKFNVQATSGNFNNLIGLPLTVFGLRPGVEWAILEMGTNLPGEIKRLCEIARPEVGIITCIKPVHLEGLKTVENIALEKGFLFESLPEDGIAILNADDELLIKNAKRLKTRKIYTYGISEKSAKRCNFLSHIYAKEWTERKEGLEINVIIDGKDYKFTSPLIGSFNISNILSAISCGIALNIPVDKIKEAVAETGAISGRMNIEKFSSGWIILDDSYNANPASMKAALEFLRKNFPNEKKNLILGDMLELGKDAEKFHIEIGKVSSTLSPSILIAIGNLSKKIAQGAVESGLTPKKIKTFRTWQDALEFLKADNRLFFNGSKRVVLLKGSRGVNLDRLKEFIEKRIGEDF